jgi:DNA-binding transcriptional MerR regulator
MHMRMEKVTFRIGQLAKQLNLERFVIRFWEKEFNVKPSRSIGGQRFYTKDDFDLFVAIKELLYTKGYTIAGARQALNRKHRPSKSVHHGSDIQQKLLTIRTHLHILRELL